MGLYFVQVRAFPTNATVKLFKKSGDKKSFGPFSARRVFLNSFDLNSIGAIESFVGADTIEKLEETRFKENAAPSPKRLGSFFQLLPCGTVVSYSFRALDPSITAKNAEELASFGAEIYRASDADALLAKQFVDGAVSAGWAQHSAIMKYDMFSKTVSDADFIEDMKWKAWHTVHFISTYDPEKGEALESNPWSSPKHEYPLPPDLNGCDVKAVAHYYFGWRMGVSDSASEALSDHLEPIKELLEPAGYMISRRSILAGGSLNLRAFGSEFVRDNSGTLSEENLRRYLALIRLNLLEVDDFSASSKKNLRYLFDWMSHCNNLDDVHEKFEQTERPISLTLKTIEEERSERQGQWLRFILLIFTSFTFLSVVADIIGLLDWEARHLELSDRIAIFVGALAFTSLMIIAGVFGGRRR